MITDIRKFSTSDLEANAHSARLKAMIKEEIKAKGPMPFAVFMERALYAPGLGYYSAGATKFDKEGDFTTAPEISPLYSRCVARQCQQIIEETQGDILECGAGTGIMAATILLELEQLGALPNNYFILEVSADLKERQQRLIQEKAPHLFHQVKWLDDLAQFHMQGIIIANEVMDAFPVHLFKQEVSGIRELYVQLVGEEFSFMLGSPQPELINYLQSLEWQFPEGYQSECNLFIRGWIKSLSQALEKGAILLMDYGFPRSEYYHRDRSSGTLMCHYRHEAHIDPLINVGLQDITAHVDFTLVAEAAESAGLSLSGFTNQASFLLSCGLTDLLSQESSESYMKLANQVKILTSPNEMGELIKVIALTKNMDSSLLGFYMRNKPVL